jgi:hypothetical protein
MAGHAIWTIEMGQDRRGRRWIVGIIAGWRGDRLVWDVPGLGGIIAWSGRPVWRGMRRAWAGRQMILAISTIAVGQDRRGGGVGGRFDVRYNS